MLSFMTLVQNGPHGISLIRHAMMGGKEAKHVVEYIEQFEKERRMFNVDRHKYHSH